jgi:RNA polymerase sigma-70 factor (ECF subfamily)
MGLAVPWEARISGVAPERDKQPESPEHFSAQLRAGLTPAQAEDAALAAACRSGDLAAYGRLYALLGARMKNHARNLLGSASDAEDAVQETFLKLQRSIASFRGQSSFATWTFRILINTCFDARRSRLRKNEISSEEETERVRPEVRAPGSHPSLKLALEHALGQLTKHQRDVFLLFEVEGFSHAEIAGMLDISETASKNTLFQAKKNLRQMLEPPRSGRAAER